MQLVRTTLRIKPQLKKAAERLAIDEQTSLQEVFNNALEQYLDEEGKKKAKKIVFKTHDLGEPLDHLRREDYYPQGK